MFVLMVDLESEMLMVTQNLNCLKGSGLISPLAIETIRICTNTTCNRSVSRTFFCVVLCNVLTIYKSMYHRGLN